MRHDSVDFNRGHAFFDCTFHTQQTNAVLVFHQFANGTHTTVTKVVNIVDVATAITQVNQRFDTGHDIVAVQRALCVFFVECKAHVHFHTANRGKVIAFAIKEQGVEQVRRSFDCGRLAWAHDAVDIHERGVAVHVLVVRHGVAHVRADIDVVDVQEWDLGNASINQLFGGTTNQRAVFIMLKRHLVASFDIDRAGFFVDDVACSKFTSDVLKRQNQFGYFAFVNKLFYGAWCYFLALFEQDFTSRSVDQIIGWTCAPHTVRIEWCNPAFTSLKLVVHSVVIRIHDRFLVQTKRVQQRCHRQLTATVDPGEHDILGIEFEIQPRPAVRNNPAGKQQLARRVRLAFVMIKEHAGGPVHL